MKNIEQNLPPGCTPESTAKEVDEAGAAILRKAGHLMSAEEIAYIKLETNRVLREHAQ